MNYSLDTMLSIYRLLNKRGQVRKDMLEAMECGEYPVKLSELRQKKKEAIRQGKQYEAEDYGLEIDKLTGCYKEKVEAYFRGISQSLLKENLRITINKGEHGNKPVYEIEKRVENMVLMKLLNKDLQRCYKVQPANRNTILNLLRILLRENTDFYLLRLDIESFYESIPFRTLATKLEDDNLLCKESLYLLDGIQREYRKKSQNTMGIPRGVNCSPFLAEIFMRDIDKRIMEMDGVYYYQRYVDDIVMMVCCSNRRIESYYQEIRSLVESKGLKLHGIDEEGKTRLIDSRKDKVKFDYLGYQITKNGAEVDFCIAENKYKKYEQRIHDAVELFVRQLSCHKKGKPSPLRQLLLELRMMTSNYKLSGNKRDILTGIRHKYIFLTTIRQLEELDAYLKNEIGRITADIIPDGMGKFDKASFSKEEYAAYIWKRCMKYSFVEGFNKHKICHISQADFKVYKHIIRRYEKTED